MKIDPTKKNVQGLAGRLDDAAVDHFDNHSTEPTTKPEIDLASWAALGGNAKPSRSDRRPKGSWKRGAR
jgi:hypothetical protein